MAGQNGAEQHRSFSQRLVDTITFRGFRGSRRQSDNGTPPDSILDNGQLAILDWDQGKSNHLKLSERAAKEYDEGYANANFSTGLYMNYELAVIDRAISLIETPSTERIALDLGCGTGRDALHFREGFKHVVGYDFSPAMLDVAEGKRKEEGIENVTFIRKDIDAEQLSDIPAASVDFINTGFGMGSFIQNLDALLADVYRVLKPGGTFTISFYNADAIVNELHDLPWTPSLSARIDPEKGTLHVNFGGDEYDIAARAYTTREARDIIGHHLQIEEVATFPTLSAVLPNEVFRNSERMRRLATIVDDQIRLNEDIAGGPYITAICKKGVN